MALSNWLNVGVLPPSTFTAITASGIIKTDDTTEATSTTDGSLQTDGGLSVAKDAVFGDDIKLLSDSAVIAIGADGDTTLTHTDGTGLTLNSTNKLTFGDAASFVQQSSDGTLRIDGEAIIDLNAATRVDVSADIKVGGEVQTASIGYTDGDNAITIADGGGITAAAGITSTAASNAFGELTLAGSAHLDSSPSDEAVSGITATFQAGEDLERGEVVYFKAGDSKMWKAVATASGTMPVVAMAAADISADANGVFLLQGFLADNGTFPSYTVGATLYAPEAEQSSQNVPEDAAPDTDGDFVQVVGFAVTANSVYFNPSNDVIEHA